MATVTTVELADLGRVLNSEARQSHSSLMGLGLLFFALGDVLSAFYGRGLALPAAHAALISSAPAAVPWAAAAFHGALIFIGYRCLPPAGLSSGDAPERELWRAVRGHGPLTGTAMAWLAMTVALLLSLVIVVASAQLPVNRAGGVALVFACIACPVALAAVLTRAWHAQRIFNDHSMLIGSAAGLGAALLFALALGPVPVEAEGAAWLSLLGAMLMSAVPISLLAALRPRQRQVYTVEVQRPDDAPTQVPFNPFPYHARGPRYLNFAPSAGQLLVLVRGENASNWELFDAGDSQKQLPVHALELRIWNLSRLSAELSQAVVVQDRHRCLELRLEIGHLTVAARSRSRRSFNDRAVEAASNILFQNSDLSGMLKRAAKAAFDQRLDQLARQGESVDRRIAAIEAVIASPPNEISVLSRLSAKGPPSSERLTAAAIQSAVEIGQHFQTRLHAAREDLRGIVATGRVAGEGLLELWMAQLGREISGASLQVDMSGHSENEGRLDTSQAAAGLELIGLRFNSVEPSLIERAAICDQRLAAAEAGVLEMIRAGWQAYRDALKDAEQTETEDFRHGTRPGSLPRRVQEALFIHRQNLRTGLPPQESDPQPPLTDPGQRQRDEPGDDGDALN